jgi:hypothetical protein
MERAKGIEPSTYSLGSCRSATELRPPAGHRDIDFATRRPEAIPAAQAAAAIRALDCVGQGVGFGKYQDREARLWAMTVRRKRRQTPVPQVIDASGVGNFRKNFPDGSLFAGISPSLSHWTPGSHSSMVTPMPLILRDVCRFFHR